MWIGIIAKLLSGIPGIAEGVLSYLNKRVDAGTQQNATNVAADKDLNLAVIQGRIEERKLAAQARAADRGSLWTIWMMPTAFAISLYQYAAVNFDSVPAFGHVVGSWRVAALPVAQATLQSSIILAGVGLVASKPLLGRIFSR